MPPPPRRKGSGMQGKGIDRGEKKLRERFRENQSDNECPPTVPPRGPIEGVEEAILDLEKYFLKLLPLSYPKK